MFFLSPSCGHHHFRLADVLPRRVQTSPLGRRTALLTGNGALVLTGATLVAEHPIVYLELGTAGFALISALGLRHTGCQAKKPHAHWMIEMGRGWPF